MQTQAAAAHLSQTQRQGLACLHNDITPQVHTIDTFLYCSNNKAQHMLA
jgi:hypothetical protein